MSWFMRPVLEMINSSEPGRRAGLAAYPLTNRTGFGGLYAAREENRDQFEFASRSRRSSTPASPSSTLEEQAEHLIAQLPTTLQS